jgi:DnaJ-class molecular chaperone
MAQEDYYRTLGVEPDATAAEIKDTYRRLALQYHPDRNPGNADAAETMKIVNEAYAVLSDPGKRKEYDVMRQRFGSSAYTHFRQNYSQEDIFTGSDIHGIFEEFARSFGLRGFDEIFKEFYGQGFHSYEIRRTGGNGRVFLFSGPLHHTRRDASPHMPSGGPLVKATRYLLKKMTGIDIPVRGSDTEDLITVEPEVARRGGPYEYRVKRRNKGLKIMLPPGIRDGQKIRLSGMGGHGSGNGNSGDLYLTVRIKQPLIQKVKSFIAGLGTQT